MPAGTHTVELLSPAKDLQCGIEAINHGADAVYIGAPAFSARAAAGNPVDDIARLCDYAHLYNARVYVAFNTIIKEDELPEAEKLIVRLYAAGADALIVQDMGILKLDIPPIPLHASTQTDNRTVEKVRFLESAGFSQVVLARELSLREIEAIARQTTVPLEVFIHGALCVSYSGQCYLSAALSGRSANRGACAQYCRLPYRMVDAEGKEVFPEKHVLSLKDLNRTAELEELMDAGVRSFKIEGRLKDVSYVKNITAWYRRQIDAIVDRRTEYMRSSAGNSILSFDPDPYKSFNRGFTSFYLHRRIKDVTSFDSPKSIGEPVGKVCETGKNSLTTDGKGPVVHNGDGMIFFDRKGNLDGFRVNRSEKNRIYPFEMPALSPGTILYRNYDSEFEKTLSRPTAVRKIPVDIKWSECSFGFALSLRDASGASVVIVEPFVREPAQKDQSANIKTQLAKLGNTPFEAGQVTIDMIDNWFIPSSLLAAMRRKAVERLIANRKIRYRREVRKAVAGQPLYLFPAERLTYLGNISNSRAEAFYRERGVKDIDPAFEIRPQPEVPLMFSKHCLRFSLGICPVHQKKDTVFKEPFYLVHRDNRLRLAFDCKACMMEVYLEVRS